MPRENSIQRSVIKALEAQGVYVVNVIAAGRNGIPDLICNVDGLFTAFECKQEGAKETKLQVVERKRILATGGHGYVVRSAAEAVECVKALRQTVKHDAARRLAETATVSA